MRRPTSALALAAAAAVLLVAPATAKGPLAVEICGASDCRVFRWSMQERRHDALVRTVMNLDQGFSFAPAPSGAAYYEIRVRAEWIERDRPYVYAPRQRLVAVGANWLRPRPDEAATVARAARGMRPWPAPRLAAVRVAGREADDPQAYAALLAALPPGDPPPPSARAVEISLAGDRVTPWSDPARPIRFFPGHDVVRRAGEWRRVPPALARTIAADGGLVPDERVRPRGGTASSGDIAAPLAVLAAAALFVLTLGRRRSRAQAT